MNQDMNEQEMSFYAELYAWVDQFEFSRPKRHIRRDFADGLFVAQIIQTYRPELIEMHNYSSVSSRKNKEDNWFCLRTKVFPKLKFKVTDQEVSDIINSKSNTIDVFLMKLRKKLESKPQTVKFEEHQILKNQEEMNELKNTSNIEHIKKALNDKLNEENDDDNLEDILDMKLKIDRLYEEMKKLEVVLDGKNRKINNLESILIKKNLL